MQVILMQKVVNLGGLGDVVKVRDGYARNFLIPTNKARRVTPENIALFEAKRAELEKALAAELAQATAQAAKLEGLMVQITRKTGADGHLFGSVTNADIVEALQAQGCEVEKSMIRMPQGPIKLVGDTHLVVALHSDVLANITVSVLGEH